MLGTNKPPFVYSEHFFKFELCPDARYVVQLVLACPKKTPRQHVTNMLLRIMQPWLHRHPRWWGHPGRGRSRREFAVPYIDIHWQIFGKYCKILLNIDQILTNYVNNIHSFKRACQNLGKYSAEKGISGIGG